MELVSITSCNKSEAKPVVGCASELMNFEARDYTFTTNIRLNMSIKIVIYVISSKSVIANFVGRGAGVYIYL